MKHPYMHPGVNFPRHHRLIVLRQQTKGYWMSSVSQAPRHNLLIFPHFKNTIPIIYVFTCLNNCLFCKTLLTHWIYGVLGCNGIKRSRTRLFTFSLYLNLENANILCRSFTHDSRIHYHGPRYRFGNKM